MMTFKIQITIAIGLVIALIMIINMIRKKSLELKYALSWIFLVAALIMIDFLPHLLDDISKFLGIASPVNMIFFLGFCFSLIIIFTLTVALSRLSERVRKLSQIVALNEKEMKDYKEMKKHMEDIEIIEKGDYNDEKNNCDRM